MFRDYGQHVFTFGLGVDGREGHKNGRSPHDRLACLAAAGGGFTEDDENLLRMVSSHISIFVDAVMNGG